MLRIVSGFYVKQTIAPFNWNAWRLNLNRTIAYSLHVRFYRRQNSIPIFKNWNSAWKSWTRFGASSLEQTSLIHAAIMQNQAKDRLLIALLFTLLLILYGQKVKYAFFQWNCGHLLDWAERKKPSSAYILCQVNHFHMPLPLICGCNNSANSSRYKGRK